MVPRMQLAGLMRRGWRPPRELAHSRPRESRLTGEGRTLAWLAVLLFLGAGIAGISLYARASREHADWRALAAAGKDAEATVIRVWSTRGKPVKYYGEYLYQADGNTYSGRVQMPRRSWERIAEGSTLPVRYLPSNPGVRMLNGVPPVRTPLWAAYLVSAAFGLAGWLVTLPLSSQRRLLAEGRPAPALVTRTSKDPHGTIVHYEFPLLSGALVEGKTGPKKKPQPVGSVLCVLYEPDRANHSAIYPLSLIRPASLPREKSTRRRLRFKPGLTGKTDTDMKTGGRTPPSF